MEANPVSKWSSPGFVRIVLTIEELQEACRKFSKVLLMGLGPQSHVILRIDFKCRFNFQQSYAEWLSYTQERNILHT